MVKTTVGIVGNGTVGQATALLQCNDISVIIYDIQPEKCVPENTTLEEVAKCEWVFICLPTPIGFHGSCQTDYIKEVIASLREYNTQAHLVIRSTVPPGVCRSFGVHSMPEFLREEHWESDFRDQTDWVVGVNDHLPSAQAFKTALQELLTSAKEAECIKGDQIDFLKAEEAELVKYARNAFLCTKVSFFNEIENFSKRLGVDFDSVRQAVCKDSRIGDSHSQVPGPDGKRGFAGKCLMKDLSALCLSMESYGVAPIMLRPVLGRNIRKDRPNGDWMKPAKPIRLSKTALEKQPIGQLRSLCAQRGINIRDCVEKSDLIEKIVQFDKNQEEHQKKQEEANTPRPAALPIQMAPPTDYPGQPTGGPRRVDPRTGFIPPNTTSRPIPQFSNEAESKTKEGEGESTSNGEAQDTPNTQEVTTRDTTSASEVNDEPSTAPVPQPQQQGVQPQQPQQQGFPVQQQQGFPVQQQQGFPVQQQQGFPVQQQRQQGFPVQQQQGFPVQQQRQQGFPVQQQQGFPVQQQQGFPVQQQRQQGFPVQQQQGFPVQQQRQQGFPMQQQRQQGFPVQQMGVPQAGFPAQTRPAQGANQTFNFSGGVQPAYR